MKLSSTLCLLLLFLQQPIATAGDTCEVKVMTRNLYHGGSDEVMTEAPPEEFAAALLTFLSQALNSKHDLRMMAIADEIADEMPDIVGLQEVNVWTYYGDEDIVGKKDDFVATIIARLEEHDLYYDIVAKSEYAIDQTTRGLVEDLRPYGFPYKAVDWQFGDVMLVRSDVNYQNSLAVSYDKFSTQHLPIGDIDDRRAWVQVNAVFPECGGAIRVVSSHLESGDADIRLLQAQELLDGPLNFPRVIMMGDLNSLRISNVDDAVGLIEAERVMSNADPEEDTSFVDRDLMRNCHGRYGNLDPKHIDHILYSDCFELREVSITDSCPISGKQHERPTHPSDHNGVVATFELKNSDD